MQRSGTEAIRTQLQPSKPKREITNITNSQNTNQTKNNMNTRKVKRHRNSDTKNRRQAQQDYRLGTVSNGLLGGGLKLVLRAKPHPQFLKWYKTFEPRYEKTGFLHMRKQRRRSASRYSAFVFATRIVPSLYFINPKFQYFTIFCDCTAWFVSDLVRNPEYRFSHNEAHLVCYSVRLVILYL